MKKFNVWKLTTGLEFTLKAESIDELESRYEWQRCATDVHKDDSIAYTERDPITMFVYRVEEKK